MEDLNKIGLNIWGIRGGYRSFCHSANLDVFAPEIMNTWKDIREFVYVTDLTVRFYALEFTPEYKVFTIYRPENDTSRTGAYVATTIYVPHSLKINRILDLMKQISDAYHKDHYDAFGNPNTNPDYLQSYWELVKNYAGNIVREGEVRSWECSAQDNTPRIMPFTSLSVVEDFFDKPYRKEFLKHQEVMFWDNDYLQNQQSHGVKFQKMETLGAMFESDGKGIAPQFEGECIRNQPRDFSIERFVREGVDITQNWQSYCFYDKTNIAIVLKKPFHQPYTYHGSMVSFDSPFVKRGDDYEFRPRIDFKSRQYEIPVNVVNVGNTPFDLYFGDQIVSISGGRGVFKLDGSQANSTCKVALKPDGITSFKVTDLVLDKFFVAGSDEQDRLQPCIIENLKLFKFMFNQECSGKLNLRRTQCSVNFSTMGRAFDFVMTAEKNASDFDIVVDGYTPNLQTIDNTSFDVKLTKTNFNLEVMVPDAIKRYMLSGQVIVKVEGKTYKGYNNYLPMADHDGKYVMGIVIDSKGNLLGCEFEKRLKGNDVVMEPKLALLRNSTNEPLELKAQNTIFTVKANETIVVPANFETNLDSQKYIVDSQNDWEGTKTITVTAKPVTTSSGTTTQPSGTVPSGGSADGTQVVYQGSFQGRYQGGKTTENKRIIGTYWYKNEKCDLYENDVKKIAADTYETIIEERQCILCFDKDGRPVAEKQKRYAEKNKKNNFKVTVANRHCNVESTIAKPKGSSEGNRGQGGNDSGGDEGGKKKRWFLFGGLGVVVIGALVALGFILGWFGGGGKKSVYTIKIAMTNGTEIDEVVADKAGREDPKIVMIDNNTIDLKKDWDKVEIKITTKNEGVCPIITVDSAKNVTSTNAKEFYEVTKDIDAMTLTVTSPSWMELDAIGKDSKLADTAAIIKYADLARNYTLAENVVNSCIHKAKDLVDETNVVSLNCFIENFNDISAAKTFVDAFESKKDSIEQEEKNKQNIKDKIKNFKEAMTAVYSTDCTITTINKVDDLYDELNSLITDKTYIKTDVILPVVRQCSAKGGSATISDDWFKNKFIPNQKKFFQVFLVKSDVDINGVNNLATYTACFSSEQIKAIRRLTNSSDAFSRYKTLKTKCTDNKYYKYVLKNDLE